MNDLGIYNLASWKISSVFVLTGGNVLYISEMQSHLSLLMRMEGLSRYRLPWTKLIAFLY